MRMIVSPLVGYMRVQFRFPISKKRRMRKKWAKDQRNFRVLQDQADAYFMVVPFQFGGRAEEVLVCSPRVERMVDDFCIAGQWHRGSVVDAIAGVMQRV